MLIGLISRLIKNIYIFPVKLEIYKKSSMLSMAVA